VRRNSPVPSLTLIPSVGIWTRDILLDYYVVRRTSPSSPKRIRRDERGPERERKRTRDASRALQEIMSMSAYPSCKLGIGQRGHVRYGALYERESGFLTRGN
jgi:hypothetical protein